MLAGIAKKKIVTFDDYVTLTSKNRSTFKVVQCHGVFDLLHIGHVRHFEAAKRFGDILTVTITPDCYVNKGPNRPCFSELLRAEAVAALDCVDYVIINASPTAIDAIKKIKPDIYIKGSEYKDSKNDITAKIDDEIAAVQSIGGEVAFTDDITFSSSTLINEYFSPFNAETRQYLEEFKRKFTASDISAYFTKAKELNVLVVGEAIIDIYHFSEVIGKAGKEPILAAKHQSTETYLGGSLALANHLSDFCHKVTCLTYLGEHAEYEEMIRANLKENVELQAIYKSNSPTIVKRRYLESYARQKLFEVYEINDDFLDVPDQDQFVSKLQSIISQYDIVISADFGHGLINEDIVNELTSGAHFLAVNAQSNAANHGFNCISKYQKADYVSIASRELQLNYRQRHLSVTEQLMRLMQDGDYKAIMITNGRAGAYVYKKNELIAQAPALAVNVIDRIGAGDAVLAITSLFAYQNAPSDLIAFIGNVVGAEAVNIMGNKSFVEHVPLLKHITHLLK